MQIIISHSKEDKPPKRFVTIISKKGKQVTIPITVEQEKKIDQINKDEN